GMILTTVGAVIDIYLFFYRLFGFGGIAGRPMLLLGTVLLVIGLQMIAIGLLGEMIIFTHARQIREYNIEEIIN
ncbi:MAG: glycosyl transferase family 2, partial [candidate division KSB1 bacterium]|nr:glycosyl transferase family 2 [candidate division KSB1 bacterium]